MRIARYDIDRMVSAAALDLRRLLANGDIIVPAQHHYLAVADKHDLPMSLESNDPTGRTLCFATFAPEEEEEITRGCDAIWALFQKLDQLAA